MLLKLRAARLEGNKKYLIIQSNEADEKMKNCWSSKKLLIIISRRRKYFSNGPSGVAMIFHIVKIVKQL